MNKLLWYICASNTAFLSRSSIDLWQALVSASSVTRSTLLHWSKGDKRTDTISTGPPTRPPIWTYLPLISIEAFTTAMPKLTPGNDQKKSAHPELFLEKRRHVWCWHNKPTVQAISCGSESLWESPGEAWPIAQIVQLGIMTKDWGLQANCIAAFVIRQSVDTNHLSTMAEFTIKQQEEWCRLESLWNSLQITQ